MPGLDAGVLGRVALVEVHLPRLDRQRAAVRHRVACVDREVHDHLLDLPAVGEHRRRVLVREHADLDVLADQAREHRRDRDDDLVQVEDDGLEHLLAREREQLLGELRRPLGGAVDLGELARAGPDADPRAGPCRRSRRSPSAGC